MSAHVHFDVEAAVARLIAETENVGQEALAQVGDTDGRAFVMAQTALRLAFISVDKAVMEMANKGASRETVESAMCAMLANIVAGKLDEGGNVGRLWASNFLDYVKMCREGIDTVQRTVTTTPMQGGQA